MPTGAERQKMDAHGGGGWGGSAVPSQDFFYIFRFKFIALKHC